MSREQPSTADVRDIEDVMLDLQKLLISKLPTNNKMILACWGTFVGASEIYWFAKGIIDEPDKERWSESYLWIHHGQLQAAHRIIRKLADNLGVPNMKYELEDKRE